MSVDLFSLQALLCCLAFFFAGIVDSVTGGGGLITIPVMLAVGIPVHYITGTNQCSAWIGSGVSAYKFVRSGNIHLKSALVTLPFAVIGSYIGARLNLIVPDRGLKIFMLVTTPVLTALLLVNRHLGEEDHADEQPVPLAAFPKCVAVIDRSLELCWADIRAFTAPERVCSLCWPMRCA